MHSFLQKLRNSSFVRHNAIFFFGSIAVGFLNYAYYPIVGRLLEPVAFGEVQALVSLFLQGTIFLTVLTMLTVNIVANYRNKQHRNEVVFELEKLALLVAAVLFVAVALGAEYLKTFLQFDSALPFVALALAFVASIPMTFQGAFLRGQKQFGKTSAVNLLASAGKIMFSVFFIWLGLSTVGAVLGIVFAQILAWGYAAVYAYRAGFRRPANLRYLAWPNLGVLAPELRYAALVLVCSLGIILQFSIDIIIVKHYFDPQTAGMYAGVATVGRIIFFLTASIAQVLLPSVTLDRPARENQRLLWGSLALLAGLGGLTLLLFALAPELVMSLLMGEAYTQYASLLPFVSITIFIISVNNLFVSYFVALRRYLIAFIVIIGAAVTYGLLIFNHHSLQAIVYSLLIGNIAMMCLLGIWVGGSKLKRGIHDTAAAHFDNRSGL